MRRTRRLPSDGWVTRAAGAVSIAAGATVVAGWAFDVEPMTTFLPASANPMVVSTAIGFVLCGLSLTLERSTGPGRAAARGAAAGALLLGAVALLQYTLGWRVGLDDLTPSAAGAYPGEMAVPTAITFVLAGAALLVLHLRARSAPGAAQVLAVGAALLPLLSLVGRLYGIESFSNLTGRSVTMALNTSLTFLVVSAGVLAARPDEGLMGTATDPGPGGVLVRRLLLPIVVALVGIGWLRLLGERAGWFGVETGVALMVVAATVIVAALVWLAARAADRTEQLRADSLARIRESEGRQRTILSSLGEGVVTTDRDARVVSVNPAMTELTGWAEDEVRGRPYAEAFPLVDPKGRPFEEGERPLHRALASGRAIPSYGFDLALVTRDGRHVPVSVTAAPVFADDGTVIGGVDVIRDITHEREVDALKSSLVTTVSHELRTPLTMIQGFSELLEMREMPPEQVREASLQIRVSAERLGRLVDDLLSVSRIEAGRLEAHLQPVDLFPVAREAVSGFVVDHEIRLDVPPELPPLTADPDFLLRILVNLISNAAKYSPPGTEIWISAEQVGDDVAISVVDDGIGMTQDEADRLFEKFFRADRPEVRAARGTGLGMYITRHLVELQGGSISVATEPGRGTTVRFTVPVVASRVGGGERAKAVDRG